MDVTPEGHGHEPAVDTETPKSGPARGVLGLAPRGRLLGIWIGAVVCLFALLLVVDSVRWVTLIRGASILAVAACLWAVIRMPPAVRAVWWGLWAFQALTVAGDLIYDTLLYRLGFEPFPSIADVFYLGAYGAVISALALLVRRRHPGRDRQTWIDTAIMTVAAACVVATVAIIPMLTDTTAPPLATVIALAYPLLDVVALSVLIRLLVGVDRLNLSLALLAMSVAVTLTADLVFNSLTAQGIEQGTPLWVEALFLVAILLLTAAATVPGATSITRPSHATRRTKGRLFGLGLGALTAPTLLAFAVWDEAGSTARMLAVASIAMILLILWGALILVSMVEQQTSLLADLARRDSLTGLANRRTWDFELQRAATRTAANGVPLTVAILDLDHFKDYNDYFGHPAGDTMLINCARAWHAQLDPPAILARYGGEEFAVLLPGTSLDHAKAVLEALRRATPGEQTVSIGYAERDPAETATQTLDRADQALYTAKSAGRDRIVAHVGDPTPSP